MNIEAIKTGIELGTAGINLITAILDYIKTKPDTEYGDVRNFIESSVKINNAEISSDDLIKFLADKGLITISGSKIYSNDSIEYKSKDGVIILSGHESITPNTNFKIGVGGKAEFLGDAEMIQNEKGVSITAKNGGSFKMGFFN